MKLKKIDEIDKFDYSNTSFLSSRLIRLLIAKLFTSNMDRIKRRVCDELNKKSNEIKKD